MLDSSSTDLLRSVSGKFIDKTGFFPVVSFEFEFYLIGDIEFSEEFCKKFISEVENASRSDNIELYKVSKETGEGQFEVNLQHTPNIFKLISDYVKIKHVLCDIAKNFNLEVNFCVFVKENQPFNGLHVHISLLNNLGINPFAKENDDQGETDVMSQALAGLLELMTASMKYFAPNESDYVRYNDLLETPSRVCWGVNNRTVSLRLPPTTFFHHLRRIEHRVPSSESDPAIVLSCILVGIMYGVENKLSLKYDKIYGRASDPQYNLEKLPSSLEEAKSIEHEFLKSYMKN